MSSVPFKTSRADGRSDSQVIVDLVKDAAAGTLYTYDELSGALEANTAKKYSLAAVRGAIYRSESRVLRELSRRLQNISGVGYRVAPASAHHIMAANHKRRSDKQLKRGLRTLQNVHWDEMDAQTRMAHEGTLLIISALYANQRALEVRQAKTEDALRRAMGGSLD